MARMRLWAKPEASRLREPHAGWRSLTARHSTSQWPCAKTGRFAGRVL